MIFYKERQKERKREKEITNKIIQEKCPELKHMNFQIKKDMNFH